MKNIRKLIQEEVQKQLGLVEESLDGINLKLLKEMKKLEKMYNNSFSFSKINYGNGYDLLMQSYIDDKEYHIFLSFDPYDVLSKGYPNEFMVKYKNIRIEAKSLLETIEKLMVYINR